MNVPNNATPLQHRLIAHANKVVGEINGEPVTRIESLLIKLEAVADKEPAIAKMLLETYGEAEKAAEQSSLMALSAVLDYKEKMGPAFERAEKAGRPPPPCYPHPADIIVTGTTFKIVGPATAEEAAVLKAMIQYRDLLFFVVEERMDMIPEFVPVEEGRKYYDKHRRLFYRFHRRIPPRLYQKFPPFRTTPRECPDDVESASDWEVGEE